MKMATFSRHVDVDWSGGLMDGKGQVKAGTGAFTLPVTFPRRVGEPEGSTSPEELIAAAHAACYAMALNATLGKKGGSATRTHVSATVTADKGESGIKIVSSKLKVVAEGLQGVQKSDFAQLARDAEKACPVSNALRALQIEVEAEVR
jgi:osmotically inducible protein OsmC